MQRSILIAVVLGSSLLLTIPKSFTPTADTVVGQFEETKEVKAKEVVKKQPIEKVETVAPPKPKPAPKPQPKPAIVADSQVKQWIVDAANHYGVDPNHLLRIAQCESGYNPNAVNYNYYENGHPSGLFQHISGYWPSRAANYGYAGASVFDAKAQAYVTAGMFRDGAAGLWECR